MDALAEIREQLNRIERLLTVRDVVPDDGGPVDAALAGRLLRCTTRTVRKYAAMGLLVKLPKTRKTERKTWFHRDNVLALVKGQSEAREWVKQHKAQSR